MLIVRIVADLLFLFGLTFADTYVVFDGDEGDWVGAGMKVNYTSGVTAKGRGGGIEVSINNDSTWFTLEFQVPDDKTFTVGNYANAERAPFKSPNRPGIDIGGDGRGCNTICGWFRVLEVQFDNNSDLKHLAINFKQNCECGPKALYGAVRINSSIPFNVNKPIAMAGLPAEAIEGANVSLNGNQSFKRDNASLSYEWLQQSGPPVQLTGSTSATPKFTAPTGLPIEGAVLVFRLEVSDALNQTDTDTTQVKINSKSDPKYHDPHVPTALAGAYQIVTAGQTVTLDGSSSSDPMKNLISYQWNQTEGPKVVLHNYNSSKPTFVAPPVKNSTDLVFMLLVKNNLGYISSAVTNVIVNPNLNSTSIFV